MEAHPAEIVEGYPFLPTLREDAKCFMESGYSGADLLKLIYICKYLNLITLSESLPLIAKSFPRILPWSMWKLIERRLGVAPRPFHPPITFHRYLEKGIA